MKMKRFESLEEMNKYLTEVLGVPAVPAGMIPDLPGGVTFGVREGIDGKENDYPYDVSVAPKMEIPDTDNVEEMIDHFTAFSVRQVEHLIAERDKFKQKFDTEVAEHEACHDSFKAMLDHARLQGYAEALAADRFPETPMHFMPGNQQAIFFNQAEARLAAIDKIRVDTETTGITRH